MVYVTNIVPVLSNVGSALSAAPDPKRPLSTAMVYVVSEFGDMSPGRLSVGLCNEVPSPEIRVCSTVYPPLSLPDTKTKSTPEGTGSVLALISEARRKSSVSLLVNVYETIRAA
jgi:hypothetical protein